jgi:anti-sigma regulatory factor (Ser/Thr protein kinase)
VTTMTSHRPSKPHAHPPAPVPSPALAGRPVPGARRLVDTWQFLDQRAGLVSSSLELGAYPEAVRSARAHARAVLWEWGIGELADNAESIIGELVLNAVQATSRARLDTPVRLTLLAGLRAAALIAVWDAAPGVPTIAASAVADLGDFIEDDTADPAQHGRGLLMVSALSLRWGTRPGRGARGGKVVWSELVGERAGAPARAEHGERAPHA